MTRATFLDDRESRILRNGACPHCNCGTFRLGPEAPRGRNMLCTVCYREYCVGPVGAIQIVSEVCAKERLKETYGIQ